MKFIKKHIKKLRLRTLISLGLLLIILPVIAFNLFDPSSISATWFNDQYAYRQQFTFTHNAYISAARKVTFSLDTAELISAGVMESDCDDTRFTDGNGKELVYELTGSCNNAATTYEVVFESINNGTNIGYVYYGNASAVSNSVSTTSYTALTPSGGDPAITTRTNEEQKPGPAGYWKFDEAAENTCVGGEDACDSTSNNFDGTFGATTTAPTWASKDQCIHGSCLYFDGSDDYVTLTDENEFHLANDTSITITGWVKTNAQGAWQNILRYDDFDSIDGDSPTTRNIYIARISTADNFQMVIGPAGSTSSVSSNTTIQANTWYHVAYVRDVTNDNLKIYINGKLDNSATDTTTGTWETTGQYPIIGRYTGEYLHGYLDDLKIYNSALTDAQIRTDYAGPTAGSAAVLGAQDQSFLSEGLIGYWPMEDNVSGTSQTVADTSGNNHDATTNGASIDCTVTGKFGLGCDVVASQSVDVADDDDFSINTTNEFTVSTWFTTDDLSGAPDIIQKGTSGQYEWSIGLTSGGDLRANVFTSSGTNYLYVLASTDAVSVGETFHTTMTVDLAKPSLRLYKNGKLLGTDTTSSGSYTNGTAVVGLGFANGTGVIDDARIYNRELSHQEVVSLYNWGPEPIVYFDFNENTGQVIYDRSGNGNTDDLGSTSGSDSNDPAWAPGKYGAGLDFDGTSDFIDLGDDSALEMGYQDWSASFWYKGTDSSAFVIAKAFATPYYGTVVTDTTVSTRLAPSSVVYADASINISDGTWHHVTSIYDRDGDMTTYVDGVALASTDISSEATTDISNTNSFSIGANCSTNCGTSGNYTDGVLDDVKIFNYALSPTQVISNMNANHPLGGSPVGSQAVYYKFDETSGSTAQNSIDSNSAITGSISGTSLILGSSCKYNNCRDFDGTDDVVTVTNTNAIDLDVGLSNGFTVTTWFNADSDGENNTGEIFQKGTSTYCRTDNESGSSTDLECSIDLATTDANLNVTSGVTLNTWHHLALVYDDASTITVYIDGINRGSDTGSGDLSSDANNLLIGGSASANFDGTIDDFKIYSAALTPAQILIDMNANSSINLGTGTSKTDDYSFTIPQPVGHWEFNENTGSGAFTTYDTSINSNNAVADSTMTESDWVPGVYGSALDFDGTDDYVSITNSDEIDFDVGLASGFSFSGWMYIRSDGSSNQGRFLQKGNARCDTRSETGSTVTIACNLDLTGTNVFDTSSGVSMNEWHHFVYVYNNASNLAFYLDGVEILGGTGTGDTDPDTGNLYIGGGNTFFDGRIDDFKVFDTPLTQTQVNYEYGQGKPIAHWKFDECQGSTAYDSSGHGVTGTITPAAGTNTSVGTCNSGNGGEMWDNGTTGKRNASLDFDGTDDYVDIGDTTYTSIYSVSFWAKAASTTESILQLSNTDTVAISSGSMSIGGFGTETVYIDGQQTTSFPDTNWHHVVVVSDTAIDANNTDIGRVSTTYFDGQIDDVQVYNYPLSAAQIKNLYNGGATRFGPETGSP